MLSRITKYSLRRATHFGKFFGSEISPQAGSSPESRSNLTPEDITKDQPTQYFRTHSLIHLIQPIAEVRK